MPEPIMLAKNQHARTRVYRVSVLAAFCVFACCGSLSLQGQSGVSAELNTTGQISIAGRDVPFLIRHLPISSFPELPTPIADALTARGCLIPQTYEAHRPENVVHASLERASSSDWAVLCSVKGQVALLIFFASASPSNPMALATAAEIDRLQPSHQNGPAGALGFNWGIDPASPRRIHEAQAGMAHRPSPPDHDCLADTILDHRTIYRLYQDGAWGKIDVE